MSDAERNVPRASYADPDRELQLLAREFGRKLGKAMAEKGMSHADLALMVWGAIPVPRDDGGSDDSDRISDYVRGDVLPGPANLQALFDALGTTVEELAPELLSVALRWDDPLNEPPRR